MNIQNKNFWYLKYLKIISNITLIVSVINSTIVHLLNKSKTLLHPLIWEIGSWTIMYISIIIMQKKLKNKKISSS